MEIKERVLLGSVQGNGCLTVMSQKYINYNGKEIILENHWESLSPDKLNRAEEILSSDLLDVVKALWTPEIISTWESSQVVMRQ